MIISEYRAYTRRTFFFDAIVGVNMEASQKQMRKMAHSLREDVESIRTCTNCLFFRNCSAARKELCKVDPDRKRGQFIEWRSRR